ncbi:unnamed protein product [Rotaria sordida]|uniref:Uncharacterized protein n=1 Tax=Rotaria sordida TaxID=392033 RepID=A0A815PKI3_9BILA|nr:unnamed protein product [Rotaria sordida]CAF1449722.1 unnamed protein product [Rotaria sordida]CAF1450761.1 unnamed protein product [Rotaria sordida]
MFSSFVRFILFLIVCLTIAHAYPPLMSRGKWLSEHAARPHGIHNGEVYDYINFPDGNDSDVIGTNGFPTWLLRSRKFCCAPPL